ncbi:MAG TPA: AAA family ATPase [Candidatus Dormibacteraeota bacterium]|nr:AAA family ATPase [Candidatus Dormibacteraeota bacterium]
MNALEGRAAVAETHVSVVFFAGDRACKLKKPVAMGFLDFSTREAREAACRREVELNRRLAPDVYLGVADIDGPDGRPCDHLVVMRRMPEHRRLSTLVRTGADVAEGVRQVARQIAGFHERVPTSAEIASAGSAASVGRNWEDNFAQMAPFVGPVLDRAPADRAACLARRYLAGRGPLFERRIASGLVRDGHGDLLADDIFLLDDGPRILDCIEFDDRLRHGDVLADVAFLAMDLERLGAPDLAARFLGWYREFSGHPHPVTLAEHYVAYRAHVRAKVACLRHAQGDPDAAREAAAFLAQALRHLERGRVRLVLVGGRPGTGKTTLAAALADATGWSLLSSDEVRRDLGRNAGPAAYGAGAYSDESVTVTYRELVARARTALGLGEPVVLDASWRHEAWRALARRVAAETASELVELRCEAPDGLAAARIAARRAAGAGLSDATVAVSAAMAADFAPWPEALAVDTAVEPGRSLASALAALRGS